MSFPDATFDTSGVAVPGGSLTVAGVRAMQEQVSRGNRHLSDDERVEMLRALTELTCSAEAEMAAVAADFDASMRAKAAARKVPPQRQGRGVAAQIAFARRESLARGERFLQLAKTVSEMPHTRAAWREGVITQHTVTELMKGTACLSRGDRASVDLEVAGDLDTLEQMSARQAGAAASAAAYRADPMSFVERRRKAEAERHTSIRPAPDVMTWFTALLTVKQGVSVHAALSREADRLRAAGDPRSRGQIMADVLVERVIAPMVAAKTGVSPGTASGASGVGLMVNVVVRDSVLLGDEDGTGWVEGYGEVPGDLLREWIADRLDEGLDVWLRRLYEKPETGELIAMDSKARNFGGGLASFLRMRDRGCREAYCDAPVRHLDHAVDVALGGATDTSNGQGVCEGHNYAKQAHGWTSRPRPGPRHTIETTTPTGHVYVTTAPRLGPETTLSPRERLVAHFYWAA